MRGLTDTFGAARGARFLARRDCKHLAGRRLDGVLPEFHLEEALHSLAVPLTSAAWLK